LDDQNLPIKKVIGKVIKTLRINRGMTQEDLAFACDVDRSYISMIEVGRNEPSVSKIFDICEGLKIKPSDFFRLVELEYGKE